MGATSEDQQLRLSPGDQGNHDHNLWARSMDATLRYGDFALPRATKETMTATYGRIQWAQPMTFGNVALPRRMDEIHYKTRHP